MLTGLTYPTHTLFNFQNKFTDPKISGFEYIIVSQPVLPL